MSDQSTTDAATVHTITWLWGQHTELAFDPSRDVLDFGWFSGSSFTLTENNGSVVISIPSNQQTYTLTGVSFADLSARNIVAKDAGAQALWTQALNDAGVQDTTSDDSLTNNTGDVLAGGFTVTWAWNQQSVVQFDPQTDQINFGWFGPDNFNVSENNGSVVIEVVGNQQSYMLQGISLSELTMSNIDALDGNTVAKWQRVLGASDQTPADTVDPVDQVPVTPESESEPEPEGESGFEPTPEPDSGVEVTPEAPLPEAPTPEAPTPEAPTPEAPTPPSDAGESVSKPIIAAYYPEWAIYSRDFDIADIAADDLTHLIYAFAKIDASGRMSLFDPYAAVEKTFSAQDSVDGIADTWDQTLAGNFNQLAELKVQNPGLTNLIAVGGWTLSGPFSDMAATEQGRANFADSAVEFLKKYTMFDGLDFDWEYPGGGGLASNTVRPEDGENYALLLQAVRQRLDALEAETGREYEISVASPAGSDKIENFNLEGLAPYVDFFNVMAYDFHGGWENITGHQAPMFDTIGGDYDIVTAVDLYKQAGVPADKIVLGAPAYTRAWAGVTDTDGDGGWQEVTSQLAPGSFERGVYDYKDVVDKVLDPDSDWTLYWDDEAQAAYVFSASEGIYSTFETPTTIALKSQWAQSQGLGGMMFWDLSGDVTEGPESLSHAAYRSWYEGATVEDISAASALQADVVVGGNGQMDSFVDYVYTPPELPAVPDQGVSQPAADAPTADEPTAVSGEAETFTISWSWGANTILDFDPQTDKLDFGWIGGDSFTLSEQAGSVVIGLPSNDQTYVLQGVAAEDMSLQNIEALDASATAQWGAFLG